MFALFTRAVLMTWICCGVTVVGAMAAGHTHTGISAAYQVEGLPCTIQLVDTDRRGQSYALISKPPFCLRHNAWSANRRYAALVADPSGLLSIALGHNGNGWGQVFSVNQVVAVQSSLAWSPDSTQLAFIDSRHANVTISTIRMQNGVPDAPRFFPIPSSQAILNAALAWSPDGQWIAFGATDWPLRQGSEELYLLNISSGSVERLTNNTYIDTSPSWSPDGRQLVFTSAVAGYKELYVMDITTRQRRRLTYFTSGYSPDWSPDGRTIAFQSDLDYDYDLYIIGPNGFGLRRLTYLHSPSAISPVWLP